MKTITDRNALRSVIVGALVASSLMAVSQPMYADDSTKVNEAVNAASRGMDDSVVTASRLQQGHDSSLTALSQEGFSAMRAVHASRLAIFNGDSELAKKMIMEAESLLMQAKATADEYTIEPADGIPTTDVWIPIDGRIGLAETFVPTPEKTEAIDKANKHIAENDKATALETLALAEIDVRYTRLLMPLERTESHVSKAKALIESGKFYEANLAMKAVEDGILSDTISLIETPAE